MTGQSHGRRPPAAAGRGRPHRGRERSSCWPGPGSGGSGWPSGCAGTLYANVMSGLPRGPLAATVAAWPAARVHGGQLHARALAEVASRCTRRRARRTRAAPERVRAAPGRGRAVRQKSWPAARSPGYPPDTRRATRRAAEGHRRYKAAWPYSQEPNKPPARVQSPGQQHPGRALLPKGVPSIMTSELTAPGGDRRAARRAGAVHRRPRDPRHTMRSPSTRARPPPRSCTGGDGFGLPAEPGSCARSSPGTCAPRRGYQAPRPGRVLARQAHRGAFHGIRAPGYLLTARRVGDRRPGRRPGAGDPLVVAGRADPAPVPGRHLRRQPGMAEPAQGREGLPPGPRPGPARRRVRRRRWRVRADVEVRAPGGRGPSLAAVRCRCWPAPGAPADKRDHPRRGRPRRGSGS